MGGSVSTGTDNDDLIDNLVKSNYIRTPLVEKVFRSVDRAFYFSQEHKHLAYRDLAWQNGNLHLSAPCIYSEVFEHLELEPGLSFLNIGSGTGYLSTMAGLILGPYGINHGVEIHSNVVDLAYEKLEQFKRTCNGIDVFEFCEPIFIVGNGLELNHDRRYDRIYCGAACPEAHHEHFKQFMKVGGILVVPYENDLLKFVRNSENSWEVISVLSVSFSTLQFSDKETKNMISLPDGEPLRLQELCRTNIRSILRKTAEKENKELTQERKRKQSKKTKKRLTKKRFVIPIYENVSNNNAHVPSSIRNGRLNFGRLIFHNYSTATFRTFIRNLARDSNDRKDNENENTRINEEPEQNENFDDDDDENETGTAVGSEHQLRNTFRPETDFEENDEGIELESLSNNIQTSNELANENYETEVSNDFNVENEEKEKLNRMEILNKPHKFTVKIKKGSFVSKNKVFKKQTSIIASTSNQNNRRQTDDEGDEESIIGQPKKREKLDSGISEESDDGKISGSNESSYSESTFSEAMEIDSDGSYFTDSSFYEENNSDIEEDRENSSKINDSMSIKYRIEMEKKIETLPLPYAIKLYLNYNRQFSFSC